MELQYVEKIGDHAEITVDMLNPMILQAHHATVKANYDNWLSIEFADMRSAVAFGELLFADYRVMVNVPYDIESGERSDTMPLDAPVLVTFDRYKS